MLRIKRMERLITACQNNVFFVNGKQCFSSFSPENRVLKIEPTNSIKFKGSRLFRYKYKMSFETIYICIYIYIFVDD